MSHRYPPGPLNDTFGTRHLAAMRDDLMGFCSRLQRQYGDVAWFRLGPFDCYHLTHPDQVHEVLVEKARSFRKPTRLKQVFGRFEGQGLVVSDGEFWLRQRRLVQPAFLPSRMETLVAPITELVSQMLGQWGEATTIDFAAEMRRLTLRIVARTLFSTSVDDAVEPLGEAVDVIQQWSMREMNRVMIWPTWLPLFGQPRVQAALAFVDSVVRRIIRERRACVDLETRPSGSGLINDSQPLPDGRGSKTSPSRGADLLSQLLNAVDADGNGRRMSDRQLRDEMVTLLLAGHETSAAALTWTGWLLATHADEQERIAHEVRSVLGTRVPEFNDLPRLVSVERAFQESLRLYPPVYFLSREAAEPVRIAGFPLRPNSQVFLNPYLTQRDPRWFPEPERFDPRRFTPECEQGRSTSAWFPFGAGPRACVGRGLAMLEGTLVIADILQQYRLRPAAGQGGPTPEWQLSLHPEGGLRLNAERR
ncbi:MAG: cytochrome P450 [Planctomycetaceae bacterium]